MIEQGNIVGIVIAGGRATRMGGADKPLLKLGNTTILQLILDRLLKQVQIVAINTNSEKVALSQNALTHFPDTLAGFQGPLAGLLSAMLWARRHHPQATHIVTIAGDTPFFPDDLTERLVAAAPDKKTIIMAASGGFNHPVFALWPLSLCNDLQKWLDETGILKVMAWVRSKPYICVDFPLPGGRDPFFNINTPEDLITANKIYQDNSS